MDDELTHKYAANISQLAAKARSVIRDLDPQVSDNSEAAQNRGNAAQHNSSVGQRRAGQDKGPLSMKLNGSDKMACVESAWVQLVRFIADR